MTKEKESLNNQLNTLIKMCENPKIYLLEYFANIKNEVDVIFVTKSERAQTELDRIKIQSKHVHLIEQIKHYEKECYHSLLKDEILFNEIDSKKTIEFLRSKLVDNEQFNLMENLINTEIDMFKKKLLLNKSIILLNQYLVHVDGAYFGGRQVELIDK
jgi:hypothetical protein